MEYMNARWMKSLHGFLHDIEWIMFHGHLDYSQKPPLGGRPNTKPGDHMALRTLTTVELFYFIMCEDLHE
jgi:hypothetical protein